MIKLAPSILSADFAFLGRDVKAIEEAGAHYVHIDVMDGMFVNNISIGIPVIKSLRRITDMTFDVHLMIERPERYIKEFAEAGADIITIHYESTSDVSGALDLIRSFGKSAAISVKPDTKIEEIYEFLDRVDMVLIMTVEPGFGGQKLMFPVLSKVEKLKSYIMDNNMLVDIEVDGGVTLENVNNVLLSGANVIVAGSAVFNENITRSVNEFYDKFQEIEPKL